MCPQSRQAGSAAGRRAPEVAGTPAPRAPHVLPGADAGGRAGTKAERRVREPATHGPLVFACKVQAGQEPGDRPRPQPLRPGSDR